MSEIHILTCSTCNTPLKGNQRKYCSRKCHNHSGNTKFQTYETQKERAFSRKLQLINLKGGKCEVCGYCKNIAVLCFHHLDPSQKELKLDSRRISNSSMERLLAEAAKCQLLCHNCHMEIHNPDLEIKT